MRNNLTSQEKFRQTSFLKVLGNSPVPWLLPLAIILLLVFVYPILEVVRLSFTNANLLEKEYEYTVDSYITLFQSPGFGEMIVVTVVFVAASVIFQLVLGFIIALLVDQGIKRKLPGTIITRTSVLCAWAIPGVVIGIIWKMLYNESDAGIINYIFNWFGSGNIPFLSDPIYALASVTIANVWRGTAFSMIILYAGIQTLPNDVLEAAKIDGAGAWQRLFKVVIPILAPIIMINLILITVYGFNTFDMVMSLTGGGPGRSTEVIALNIHSSIFRLFDLGKGAATAVVLLSINIVMTLVYFRFMEKK
jgi:multiple sugar transport system permease protein